MSIPLMTGQCCEATFWRCVRPASIPRRRGSRDWSGNNIVGVYHIFEEAQKASVKRLIVASSGQVVWWQRMRGPLPVSVDVQPTPRYWYAAAKMFLEGAGRSFAEKFGMEVIAVRLGWC